MIMDIHPRRMGTQGFTLMELMVVIAMSTIILTAIVGLFAGLTRSYTTESARTTAQQDIRAAMNLMAMEIREAGLDPTGDLDTSGITNGFVTANTNAASIAFVADFNYDGDEDPDERIMYRVENGRLIRRVAGQEDDMLENVVANTASAPTPPGGTMPVFAYYDEDGDWTTTIKDIRIVAITLTIEEPAGRDGMVTRTLTQRVRLRNSN
ncbi:prepilin-type N-terminal cleavage/methylation domain-containing protein [Desulfosarcina sp. OttesenSCG-928-G10]|nr:prepilin-type N-terminal cleavage/methylation domain-containing protein [Desulfosarcina sp. OttesenSCG-928-G10]MDL2320862.1 prepilin-type N-terminal cleavage/methylation domain-containing protein [Desulfosarcina sp. OttesenSCG-928-B08]